MQDFYCAGNWKMNKSAEQAAEFVRKLKTVTPAEAQSSLVLLPPALVAWQVAVELKGTQIAWGGQNSYFTPHGAFTGENSPQVLREMGARFCLVGHSERRQLFAEMDELLAKKIEGLQKLELTPILCVGESLDDRRWGRTSEVVLRQLRTGLSLASFEKPLWLAYEPVWAIGTGQVATPEQVDEVHDILRKALRDWNAAAAERIPILYGGSVKVDNAAGLANIKNVNGFLIGGASLDAVELLQIYKNATAKAN
jgi:triosephosphate isomerase